MWKDIIVKKSNIHGKWVFALRNFFKWEIVLKWKKMTISKKEFLLLEEDEKNYVSEISWKYILMQSPEKYVNYSCNSNTNIIDYCDVAIKNIRKWEEITSNYLGVWTLSQTKCNCWASICKWIVSI